MEKETLFTDTRWYILKCLSEEPASPTQIAKKLNTTIANVSQQLRLLEALDLVKKERIRNRDKGKPRMLFSLARDMALLVPTAKDFAQRTLIPLADHQKHILRIWLSPVPEIHYAIEKLWWKLEEHLDSILAIAIVAGAKRVYTVSENKSLAKFTSKGVEHLVISRKELDSLPSPYFIYQLS